MLRTTTGQIHIQPTAVELLEDAAGDPQKVWIEESIEPRRLRLNALYFSCIPTFAVAVLALVQSLYCARRRDYRRRPDGKLVPFPSAAKTQEPSRSSDVPQSVSVSFNKAGAYHVFIWRDLPKL